MAELVVDDMREPWDQLVAAAEELGMVESPSQFADRPALWLGREVAHPEGDGEIAVRAGRRQVRRLDPPWRPRASGSDWAVRPLVSLHDVSAALLVLSELAAAGHVSPPAPDDHVILARRRLHR